MKMLHIKATFRMFLGILNPEVEERTALNQSSPALTGGNKMTKKRGLKQPNELDDPLSTDKICPHYANRRNEPFQKLHQLQPKISYFKESLALIVVMKAALAI